MKWLIGAFLLVGSCTASVGCTASVRLPESSVSVAIEGRTCYEHSHWWSGSTHIHCD